MEPTQVTKHVYGIDTGAMSVFLIVLPEELTLIDAGFPGTMSLVEQTVRQLGRSPEEITNVLMTHHHPDHAAGLAEVKKATGARVWMHPADAALVRTGTGFRRYKPSPGLYNHYFAHFVVKKCPPTYEPVNVDVEANPGDTLPVAGGIKAIGTPGHAQGHLCFLWPEDKGVLFTGDAGIHRGKIAIPTIYEDLALMRKSLRSLGDLGFDTACFAHGPSIVGNAGSQFPRP